MWFLELKLWKIKHWPMTPWPFPPPSRIGSFAAPSDAARRWFAADWVQRSPGGDCVWWRPSPSLRRWQRPGWNSGVDLEKTHIYIYVCVWNLDEALSSPLQGKQTKGSGVSATHCTQRGADGVCNTLVPETGPPFWKPFLLPAILQLPFLGPVFGPIFGTTKEQTGAAHGPDSVHLLAPAFLLQCKPPWTHTHTSV